jgi:glycosyltransferase involved in cell wall biosynthesis
MQESEAEPEHFAWNDQSSDSVPFVSIVTPCFNEEANLPALFSRVRTIMHGLPFSYEHIVIDNASTDSSRSLITAECHSDARVKAIFNMRNYGHIRSPFHGLLQANGDCIIGIASDLQEPPELIPELLSRWTNGAKLVLLRRESASEPAWKQFGRSVFYRILNWMSPYEVIPGATGSGIYDRSVMEYLKALEDPYPFLRGLVSEAGFPIQIVKYHQPSRNGGRSKNNLSTLYDIAMLGFTSSGRVPLRAVSFVGYTIGVVALLTGFYYLLRKLFQWDSFQLGLAPLATGLFFLGSIQLISLGIIGEYVGNIFMRQRRLPLVIEDRRLNFDR